MIVGPYSEKFDSKNVEYVHDTNHEKHDILGSLMEAKDFLKNDVLVLYSDVIFEPQIIKQLLDSAANISIAVDSNWEIKYEGRTNHPKNEAENVEINNDGKIIKIKKRLNEIYSKHSGKDLKDIEKIMERDKYFSPEESIKFGLIDKVIESRK